MASMVLSLLSAASAAISLAVLLVVAVRFKQRSSTSTPLVSTIDSGRESTLRTEIASLAARIADLESESRGVSDGAVRSAMNLSKRTQALRLHRLGQGPETIAKSVHMTPAEVHLLLKVQQVLSRN